MINGVPRILIIRLSAIGDVVRVLPALQTLRETYPNAQIDWAVETKSATILEDHPCIDQVLVFDRTERFVLAVKSFLGFCARVRRGRYDVVIDFHGILKSGLIAGCSRAPERYGFARPRSQEGSWLFTRKRLVLPFNDLNRTEENLLLCGLLCPHRDLSDVRIQVSPDVQEEVNAFFEATFDGGKQVIAVHAPVDREEKRWPTDYFVKLIDLLEADGRFEVMLTWGPGQFREVEDIVRKSRRNPVVAPETRDLKHYTWLIHRADLYFGGDTGPMHIAAAMGTPVVAVFGGTDPKKHAPYQRPCEILYADPENRKLPAQERLRRITPEMAYDACVRILTP